MQTKSSPPAIQLTLSPSLFNATGKAPPRTVAVPPLWDPFSGAAPMDDAAYDRWLDQQDREREWARDARD